MHWLNSFPARKIFEENRGYTYDAKGARKERKYKWPRPEVPEDYKASRPYPDPGETLSIPYAKLPYEYRVQRGETLEQIARHYYGDRSEMPMTLFIANHSRIGGKEGRTNDQIIKRLLRAGHVLILPDADLVTRENLTRQKSQKITPEVAHLKGHGELYAYGLTQILPAFAGSIILGGAALLFGLPTLGVVFIAWLGASLATALVSWIHVSEAEISPTSFAKIFSRLFGAVANYWRFGMFASVLSTEQMIKRREVLLRENIVKTTHRRIKRYSLSLGWGDQYKNFEELIKGGYVVEMDISGFKSDERGFYELHNHIWHLMDGVKAKECGAKGSAHRAIQ